MFTKKLLSFIFSLAVCVNFSQAQNAPADGKWSVQECIDFAMNKNISIKQAKLNVNSYEATLFQSKMGLYPTVNGQLGYGLSTGRVLNQTTYQYEQGSQQYLNPSLNMNLNLFRGLQQQNTIKQNKTVVTAYRFDAENSQNTVILNIVNYYLQVLNNKEQVEVAKNQIKVSQEQVDRTARLVEAGSKPETDLYDLKSQLANDELSLVTAENALRLAKLNLMQQMNLPFTDSFEIEGVQLNDPTEETYKETTQQIYDIAQGSQPNVKAADTRIESSQLGVAVAKGGLYPTLSLQGSLSSQYSNRTQKTIFGQPVPKTDIVGYVNNDPSMPVLYTYTDVPRTTESYSIGSQFKDYYQKYVGLNLSIPIFNAWQTRTRITTASITKQQAELTAQNTRVQLRQTIEQAYNDMVAASKKYAAYKKQVEALELSFKSTSNRFQVGLANSLDVSLAQNNLSKAKANFVQAKYDYIFRTKILDFYQNKPITF
jgi:outer membrane protein